MPSTTDRLHTLDTEKLMDVVRNHRQYGYDDKIRETALSILESRGLDAEILKLTGNLENPNYELALHIYDSFKRNSVIAYVLYGISFAASVAYLALSKEEPVLWYVNLAAYILFSFFLIKTFFNQSELYKLTGEDFGTEGALLYLFIGMPFYIFSFFYFRSRMKEHMSMIE